MYSLVLLSAILCAIVRQGTAANITKSFQSNGRNTAIVYLEISTYLSVTIEENTLSINQIFEKKGSNTNIPPCKLIIDPFEDAILGRINAIGFMQSIVVWGVRSVHVTDEIKNTIYTMLVVDPHRCKYRPLHLPIDQVPVDHPIIPPQVQIVSHKMRGLGFEVFYQTLKRCAPCQYYPKDLRITDVERQMRLPIMEPSKSLRVNAFMDVYDRNHNGYFLAYNYGIGTARLEYLDTNFTTLASRYLNHTVDATSIVVYKADRQNVAACWQRDRDQITCERYDSGLSTTISYHVQGDTISILFDVYENAYIGTAKKSGGVQLQIYNVFGKLIDDIDFGTVGKSAQQLEIYAFLEDYGNPHDYCLVVKEYHKFIDTQADYSVKCINVREYAKSS